MVVFLKNIFRNGSFYVMIWDKLEGPMRCLLITNVIIPLIYTNVIRFTQIALIFPVTNTVLLGKMLRKS